MLNTPTPLAANPDTASTPESTPVNINVVANDTNEGGGTLTLTGVTQGAHGTVAITPTPNYAVKILNGQNINAGPVLAYDKNQPWTMMTSLNVAQNPTEAAVIFTNANAAPYPCYEAWIDPTGHLRVRIISSFPANYIDVRSSVVVTDGKWHNVAVTYDGSSSASGVKIFLDGMQDTATKIIANSLTGSIVSPTRGPLIIGNQTNWPFALNGSLDYFSISNEVRSTAYIAQYSSPGAAPPIDANTVLYYNFNEDTGSVAHDLSSDGYAATLSSSSMWTLGPVVPATVTYTPAPGFVGTDTFSYTETNGAGTATGQVTVTVNGVAIAIQTDGSTTLVEFDGNYYLDAVGGTSGPELKYHGANVTVGEFTGWVPIGAVQTASGYDVAWKETGTDQYTVWTTDKNGNFINSIGVVSGTSSSLESYEPVFGQDLNGDGTIVIQTDGSTRLVQLGSNYFLDAVGGTSGPELKYHGANVTVGEFTGWVPIGAVQTASGYDVAWKETGTVQYTVWTTDNNGNFINSIGVVSGTSSSLESYEPVFGKDLNGDRVIGLYAAPGTTLQIGMSLSIPSGSATIGTGATLELQAADSASVTFQSSIGTLRLDHSTTFSGKIFNFTGNGSLSGSDQIDLRDIKYFSFHSSFANDVLTVTDSSSDITKLSFSGSYSLANFHFASDGGGGTIVYDPPVLQSDSQSATLSGSGLAAIDDSASVELAVAERQNVIDLPAIAFDAPNLPNGNQGRSTLSLMDGSHNANVALLGQYMASSFAIAGDHHGGTVVVAEAPQASPSLLANPQHA